MKQMLFVCSANRLRSVVAEHMFRSLLFQMDQDLARQIEISSAGVDAAECIECINQRGMVRSTPYFGKAPASSAVAALAKRGVDISGYRSLEVNVAMVQDADLVLTAQEVNKRGVLEICPEADGKVFTLMEFSGDNLYYLFHDCRNMAPELRYKPDFGDVLEITEALTVEVEKCLSKAMPKILDFRR